MMPTDTQSRQFDFLRSFSLLSLLAIVCTTGASAALLARFLTQNMLARDAIVTMQFVQSLVQVDDPSAYFAPDLPRTVPSPARFETNRAALETFFRRIVAMPEVVRANVYNDERRITWSSDPHLIGQQSLDNPELGEALTGRLSVQVGIAHQYRKAEHVNLGNTVSQFVENYIPIWNHTGDRVVGAVEVYRVPDALFHAIMKGKRLVWSSAAVGGMILYGSLFWIVRRAASVIRRQHEQLIESETMATVGAMASAIAHNLRNALASVRSSAEIAVDETSASLLCESAADIITTVDQLEQWIRELLTYARPLAPAPKAIQIRAVIEETLKHFQALLTRQDINLILDVSPCLPLVRADKNLLRQACYSLLANAIEAMPDGGTLTVGVQLAANRRSLRFHIIDTGLGVPKHQMDKIFMPFFSTKHRGLGVGLTLTRQVVECHGGTLTFTSEDGQGTTVALFFPIME